MSFGSEYYVTRCFQSLALISLLLAPSYYCLTKSSSFTIDTTADLNIVGEMRACQYTGGLWRPDTYECTITIDAQKLLSVLGGVPSQMAIHALVQKISGATANSIRPWCGKTNSYPRVQLPIIYPSQDWQTTIIDLSDCPDLSIVSSDITIYVRAQRPAVSYLVTLDSISFTTSLGNHPN